jgi:phosphoserine phosphatase
VDPDSVAALHVFDMDGTLLVGTTANRQIASIHGSEAPLVALERRFAAGEIDTRAFAVAIHQLWQDLRPDMVAAAFAASPWMTGVAEGCGRSGAPDLVGAPRSTTRRIPGPRPRGYISSVP